MYRTRTPASGAPPLLISLVLFVLYPPYGGALRAGDVMAARFLRGDVNDDGVVDIDDAVALQHDFNDGTLPACADAADADDSGVVDVLDVRGLFGYAIGASHVVPPPFPGCGEDPTADSLPCAGSGACASGSDEPEPGPPRVSSITRHGITWSFAQPARVGAFVNGDPWVVGPVTVGSVLPAPAAGLHGSMVNPRFGDAHGYDRRILSGYDAALTVRFPLTLEPGESLVSTESWRRGEPGHPHPEAHSEIMPEAPRPSLKRAAVLTCLDRPPPPGSFRPSFVGLEKRLYNTADLRWERLPQLPPPAAAPGLAKVADDVERIWPDHKPYWSGRYIHPSANMLDYGRDSATQMNDAILLLLLDVPHKERLLVSVVQKGIDLFGTLRDEGHFNWGGGHGNGRKWPILFAGVLLDDLEMLRIGFDYGPEHFHEDCQTFYVTAEDRRRFPQLFPVIGAPAWAEWHCTRRTDDKSRGYRTCCTANGWVGAVIGARILRVMPLWNWPALFDYTDAYMRERAPGDWQRSWSPFAEAMWDQYRGEF